MTRTKERVQDLPELDALREAYVSIRAPDTLAVSIRRAVNETVQARRRWYWVPVTVGALAVVGVALMISVAVRQDSTSESSVRARQIPLSMVRGHLPTHPGFDVPSLGDIRTVPIVPSPEDFPPDDPGNGEEPQSRLPTPHRPETPSSHREAGALG